MSTPKLVGWLIIIGIIGGGIVAAVLIAGWIEFFKFLGALTGILLVAILLCFAINLIEEN